MKLCKIIPPDIDIDYHGRRVFALPFQICTDAAIDCYLLLATEFQFIKK